MIGISLLNDNLTTLEVNIRYLDVIEEFFMLHNYKIIY